MDRQKVDESPLLASSAQETLFDILELRHVVDA
jgi:hypothetical protein